MLETDWQADFEAGKFHFEASGVEGVNIITCCQMCHPVTGINTNPIIGNTGGEAPVEAVVVYEARVAVLPRSLCGKTDLVVVQRVFAPTVASVYT